MTAHLLGREGTPEPREHIAGLWTFILLAGVLPLVLLVLLVLYLRRQRLI